MAALLVAVLGLFGDNLKELFEAIADTLSDAARDVKDGSANIDNWCWILPPKRCR
jgi:hypothetical protein